MTASNLLEVRDLRVSFGEVRAVDGVSFDVAEGALVGLIGANGAGKTTILDALTGFVRATGRARFAGHDLLGLPAHARATLGLTRTWQSVELFDDLTVRENLLVAMSAGQRWTERLNLWRRHPDDRPRLVGLLAELGLGDVLDRTPDELSHGQRKLVGVARGVVAAPRLLLLDEPAAGLDATESRAFGEHLRRLAERGLTMLLVDHDMELVLGVCDHVYVVDHGQRIASGAPDEIRADERVVAAYLGEVVP